MGNQVKGAFTVRFIRTGDQIYVTRNVVKFDASGTESGAALFQAIDSTSGTINPDWKTEITEQPALKISVKSAMGNPVTVIEPITWTWKGNAITFNAAAETSGTYAGWYKSKDNMFVKKTTIVDNVCYCYLRFIDNAASATVLSNQTIGFTINYTTSGMNDTVSGTEDVLIQQAGADSYSVNITTDCSTLNKDQTSTTLTATCLYGVEALDDSKYTLEWYKDFVKIEGQTSKTLTVTRDDVDGSSVYSVKLLVGTAVKAVDAQRIVDEGDEWQVVAEPSGTSPTAISATSEAKYTLKLKKNGTDYSGTPTWTWAAYNALNAEKSTGTTSTVTLTKDDAECTPEEGQTYYSDVSVVAQATID